MEDNNNKIFNIPILFLIFNRLDTTKQVFEMIRKVTPQKLYIASDGPRNNRENEKEKVDAVREYVLTSINWDCEVRTLFGEENLGCGRAVSGAISWFFENEEMGIILEDDCLPSISFFSYCKELLEYYKDDTRIYSISGYNPLTYTKTPYSYYFAWIQHCWGWASWKRAWNYYTFDIKELNKFIGEKKLNKIFTRSIDRYYWIDIFRKMENHEIDTWDYQWIYNIFNNNGICINPAKNLITNIGFGLDATHTISNDQNRNNQQRFEVDILLHPKKININNRFIIKINKDRFEIDATSPYKKMLKNNKFIYASYKYIKGIYNRIK